MAERWRKVIAGNVLPRYEVSNTGRVRSWSTKKRGADLKQRLMANGYFSVPLSATDDIKGRPYLVHRLVAAAFIGPCPEGQEVNHKDGVKTNNRAENLEYVTRSENRVHALELGLSEGKRGETNHNAKLSAREVLEIRTAYARGEASAEVLAARFGVSRPHISDIVRGDRWAHLGGPITKR